MGKINRGGRRAGAGRKRHSPPIKRRCIGITDEQAKLLRMWGKGSLSLGLRWLIEAAAPLIHKKSIVESPKIIGVKL